MSDWISVDDKLPEEDGRYLVLETFMEPCISNDSIVRAHVPFVSNYRKEKGWMLDFSESKITHWATIPDAPNY